MSSSQNEAKNWFLGGTDQWQDEAITAAQQDVIIIHLVTSIETMCCLSNLFKMFGGMYL